jgi:hypothetical protein
LPRQPGLIALLSPQDNPHSIHQGQRESLPCRTGCALTQSGTSERPPSQSSRKSERTPLAGRHPVPHAPPRGAPPCLRAEVWCSHMCVSCVGNSRKACKREGAFPQMGTAFNAQVGRLSVLPRQGLGRHVSPRECLGLGNSLASPLLLDLIQLYQEGRNPFLKTARPLTAPFIRADEYEPPSRGVGC